MSNKVLLAVGDKTYTNILINTFSNHPEDFSLCGKRGIYTKK